MNKSDRLKGGVFNSLHSASVCYQMSTELNAMIYGATNRGDKFSRSYPKIHGSTFVQQK